MSGIPEEEIAQVGPMRVAESAGCDAMPGPREATFSTGGGRPWFPGAGLGVLGTGLGVWSLLEDPGMPEVEMRM